MEEILKALMGGEEEKPPSFQTPNISIDDVFPMSDEERRYNEIKDRQMEEGRLNEYLMSLLMEQPMMGDAEPTMPKGYPTR